MAGRRADPGGTRAGELLLPVTGCSTREGRPCISPGEHTRADHVVGGTGQPIPCTREWESGTCPLPCMPCGGMGGGNMPHTPDPLSTSAGGRASLGGMRTKELVPSLTNCSNWESGPYTLPGHNSRAGPGGYEHGGRWT